MAGCSITVRQTKSGPRYHVRYRTGGRATQVTHAGSFKTLGEAILRRGVILDELAAGRDPKRMLAQLRE